MIVRFYTMLLNSLLVVNKKVMTRKKRKRTLGLIKMKKTKKKDNWALILISIMQFALRITIFPYMLLVPSPSGY